MGEGGSQVSPKMSPSVPLSCVVGDGLSHLSWEDDRSHLCSMRSGLAEGRSGVWTGWGAYSQGDNGLPPRTEGWAGPHG